MFNAFRSGNPFSVFLLLIYTFVLKLFLFFHPIAPLVKGTDGLFYRVLMRYLLHYLSPTGIGFSALAVAFIFIQASLLNRIVYTSRLLPKHTYFPAMSYVLLTSFFREWNQFSSALLVSTLLIWAFAQMLGLYGKSNARGTIYNIGFIIGLSGLFYFPAIIFMILALLSLLINRTFHFSEWLIALLGTLSPFYFLCAYLFLTDQTLLILQIPVIGLSYPQLQQASLAIVVLTICVLFFLASIFLLQRHFFKLLIQYRKSWSIVLCYLLVAIVVSFLNLTFSINTWVLAVAPLSIFMANVWWHVKRIAWGNLIHLLCLALAFVVEYW